MFEYINHGFILTSGILLFMAFSIFILEYGKTIEEGTTYKINKFVVFVVVFAIAMPLYDAHSTNSIIDSNVKSFNKREALKCFGGFSAYLVSKESGWELRGDSFLKESLLIRADSCSKYGE